MSNKDGSQADDLSVFCIPRAQPSVSEVLEAAHISVCCKAESRGALGGLGTDLHISLLLQLRDHPFSWHRSPEK
ncbi:hypothetical protein EK904_007950 [Melospiza melodia maxima]|nr:hypothetical protein EK904_007950 [Melospiza melodia maxima]